MILILSLVLTSLGSSPSGWGAELPSVVASDITLSPPNRSLRSSLKKVLQDYRDSLNAVGLSPSPNRLARGERERMNQLLESRGYYDADIIYRIVDIKDVDLTWRESLLRIFQSTPDEGERIQYRIDTGPQYQVLSVSVEGVDLGPQEDWPESGVGAPLVAEDILADQSRLQAIVDEQDCYFRLNVSHEVRLVEEENGGHVIYHVMAADPSRIGQIQFTGTEGVSEDFLRRQTSLKPGDCFSRADIDQAVLNLYQTSLFATVRRSLNRNETGNVTVQFDLVQRPPRTVSAGAGWDTDRGFGLKLGWEHRNLGNRAQRLEVGTELWQRRQQGNVTMTLPGFLEARNTLVWDNTVSHDTLGDNEYYEGESRATISRQASPTDTYSYGVAYSRKDEREDDRWKEYSLLSLPLSYEYDETGASLNPRTGKRYRVGLEPVWSLSGSSDPFYIVDLGWSSFRSLNEELVLANKLGWTSIWPMTKEADLDRIPTSDRLLTGGGGSVRGYPYLSIGIDDDDEKGGTQEWSGTLELRGRFTENWGAAIFTDVASVSEEWNPTRQQEWFFGAGVGARYYTQFAPIRFDLAFPLNKRESDPSFQIYLSLGQSF